MQEGPLNLITGDKSERISFNAAVAIKIDRRKYLVFRRQIQFLRPAVTLRTWFRKCIVVYFCSKTPTTHQFLELCCKFRNLIGVAMLKWFAKSAMFVSHKKAMFAESNYTLICRTFIHIASECRFFALAECLCRWNKCFALPFRVLPSVFVFAEKTLKGLCSSICLPVCISHSWGSPCLFYRYLQGDYSTPFWTLAAKISLIIYDHVILSSFTFLRTWSFFARTPSEMKTFSLGCPQDEFWDWELAVSSGFGSMNGSAAVIPKEQINFLVSDNNSFFERNSFFFFKMHLS